MSTSNLRIVFFKGKGLLSALIRWQTRGKFSHVGLAFPDNAFFESWTGSGKKLWRNGGVAKKLNWQPEGDETIATVALDDAQMQRARAFCESNLGRGYDFRSVIRFLTRIKPASNDKFFCSELVMDVLRHAGVDPLNAPSSVISPAVLWFAPVVGASATAPSAVKNLRIIP